MHNSRNYGQRKNIIFIALLLLFTDKSTKRLGEPSVFLWPSEEVVISRDQSSKTRNDECF